MESLIEQIKRKAKEEVALNLLKERTDPKLVAKVTGLSVKQVNTLLKKIEKQLVT